jgi:hypothetical protein
MRLRIRKMVQCVSCAFTASVSSCVQFLFVFSLSTVAGKDKRCSVHSQRVRMTMNESRLCFGPFILDFDDGGYQVFRVCGVRKLWYVVHQARCRSWPSTVAVLFQTQDLDAFKHLIHHNGCQRHSSIKEMVLASQSQPSISVEILMTMTILNSLRPAPNSVRSPT